MNHDPNLKGKTIEAMQQYREELLKVETLEQEEASARRVMTEMVSDIERAIVEDCTSALRQN
ncbi:hypothetical protein, partial [Acinetobacter baumannii]|uniref:hypothetical protein n=1 Tax=Acinetobacter baumannii TaxID=470 RepID=UPI001111B1F6